MKKSLILITALAVMSTLLLNREISAQSVECAESATENVQSVDCSKPALAALDRPDVGTILEEDYPYLIHLSCLKNGYFKGWNVKLINIDPPNPSHFVLQSTGNYIHMHAVYDKDGRLIEGELRLMDVALPKHILEEIFQNFSGWKITANEKYVRDFDREKTEYKVILQNGSRKQTLYFGRDGSQAEI